MSKKFPSGPEEIGAQLEKFPAGSFFKYVTIPGKYTLIGIVESAVVEKITDPTKDRTDFLRNDFVLEVKFSTLYEIDHVTGETKEVVSYVDFNPESGQYETVYGPKPYRLSILRVSNMFEVSGKNLLFSLTNKSGGIFAPANDAELQKSFSIAQIVSAQPVWEVKEEEEESW